MIYQYRKKDKVLVNSFENFKDLGRRLKIDSEEIKNVINSKKTYIDFYWTSSKYKKPRNVKKKIKESRKEYLVRNLLNIKNFTNDSKLSKDITNLVEDILKCDEKSVNYFIEKLILDIENSIIFMNLETENTEKNNDRIVKNYVKTNKHLKDLIK